jgi:hypothetical protein
VFYVRTVCHTGPVPQGLGCRGGRGPHAECRAAPDDDHDDDVAHRDEDGRDNEHYKRCQGDVQLKNTKSIVMYIIVCVRVRVFRLLQN